MANIDGRGPLGMGPRSGRGLGICSGNSFEMSRFGRISRYGQGNEQACGRGYGRKFMHNNVNFNSTYYKNENISKSKLMEEKNMLENRLEEINDLME